MAASGNLSPVLTGTSAMVSCYGGEASSRKAGSGPLPVLNAVGAVSDSHPLQTTCQE